MSSHCTIVDLDLTLSDSRWREALLERPGKNTDAGWDTFHAHAGADNPIPAILFLVAALQKHSDILILTSRPEAIAQDTLAWLRQNGVSPSLVVMRPDDDESSTADLKRRQLAYARSLGYDPKLAIDDDKDVAQMLVEEGLVVMQPHLPEEG